MESIESRRQAEFDRQSAALCDFIDLATASTRKERRLVPDPTPAKLRRRNRSGAAPISLACDRLFGPIDLPLPVRARRAIMRTRASLRISG